MSVLCATMETILFFSMFKYFSVIIIKMQPEGNRCSKSAKSCRKPSNSDSMQLWSSADSFFFFFNIWRVWIKLKWRLWTRTTLFTLLPSWLALAANHRRLMSLLAWTGLTHQRHATLHDGARGSKQAAAWEICAIGRKIEKQSDLGCTDTHTRMCSDTMKHHIREEASGFHCSHWLQSVLVGGQLFGCMPENNNWKSALIHTCCNGLENPPEAKAAFSMKKKKSCIIKHICHLHTGSPLSAANQRGDSLKGITTQLQPPAL